MTSSGAQSSTSVFTIVEDRRTRQLSLTPVIPSPSIPATMAGVPTVIAVPTQTNVLDASGMPTLSQITLFEAATIFPSGAAGPATTVVANPPSFVSPPPNASQQSSQSLVKSDPASSVSPTNAPATPSLSPSTNPTSTPASSSSDYPSAATSTNSTTGPSSTGSSLNTNNSTNVTGYKAGIGVAAGIAAIALIVLAFVLFRNRRL